MHKFVILLFIIAIYLCFNECIASDNAETCESSTSKLIWLDSFQDLKFAKTAADQKAFNKFESFFNPIFSFTHINGEDYARRMALAQVVHDKFDSLPSIETAGSSEQFILPHGQRDSYWAILKGIQEHVQEYPQDTSANIWASNVALRLGDFDGYLTYIKQILNTIDRSLPSICKSFSKLREMKVRNDECIGITKLRSSIVYEASDHMFLLAATYDDHEAKLHYLNLGMDLFADNYHSFSVADRYAMSRPPAVAPGSGTLPMTTRTMLRHYMQQFEYLCNKLKQSTSSEYCKGKWNGVLIDYEVASEAFKYAISRVDEVNVPLDEVGEDGVRGGKTKESRGANEFVYVPADATAKIGKYMYRDIYTSEYTKKNYSSIIDKTNLERIGATKYSLKNNDSIFIIDNVFTPEALEAYRELSLESTIWNSAKLDGYMCSFLDFGFASPIVAQTIAEFQSALPNIFCNYKLMTSWGYKYSDGVDLVDGIGIHGDAAAVNVNCWIVPETEIFDDQSGGKFSV